MTRVYKFLSTQDAIDDLISSRLKISIITDLNDPFDFLKCKMQDENYQNAFDMALQQLFKENGVICFSENWSETLLWSHYADKHKGICLGFDVLDEYVKKVDYIKNQQELCHNFEIALSQKNQENRRNAVINMLYSKYIGWDYEKEVRMYANLDEKDGNGNYFSDFNDKNDRLVLREIILGVRCDKTMDDFKKHIAGYDGVKIKKARLDFETFKVVEDKDCK